MVCCSPWRCLQQSMHKNQGRRKMKKGLFLRQWRRIRSLRLRTRIAPELVGVIRQWHSWNLNCFVWERVNMIYPKMFTVYNTYLDRADAAVRTHGDVSFSQGGSFYDVIYGMELLAWFRKKKCVRVWCMAIRWATIPNFPPLQMQWSQHVAKGKLRKLQSDENNANVVEKSGCCRSRNLCWQAPEKFTYKGKEYTPQSFYKSTGLNPSDYVSLTSYTHRPFYTQFPIEVQDNWRHGLSYNLPIDELMEVFDNAINTAIRLPGVLTWANPALPVMV